MNPEITKVFNQFAVLIGEEVKLYPTEDSARSAATLHLKGEEFRTKALAYTDYIGSTGKAAKTTQNIIVAFLAWNEESVPVQNVPEGVIMPKESINVEDPFTTDF